MTHVLGYEESSIGPCAQLIRSLRRDGRKPAFDRTFDG